MNVLDSCQLLTSGGSTWLVNPDPSGGYIFHGDPGGILRDLDGSVKGLASLVLESQGPEQPVTAFLGLTILPALAAGRLGIDQNNCS